MEPKNVYDFSPVEIFPGEGSFEMKIGGTVYEVHTHFSNDGRESVLEQFQELILKQQSA